MSEQRKTQRFDLKLPIELVKPGSEEVSQIGETRNLSSNGVLFNSVGKLRKGDPIEYLVTLPTQGEDTAVRLRCMGKVVRVVERDAPEGAVSRQPFTIAATLERHEFLRG